MNISYTARNLRYNILIPKEEFMVVATIRKNQWQDTEEWNRLVRSRNVISGAKFYKFKSVFGMTRDSINNIINNDADTQGYKHMIENNQRVAFGLYTKIVNSSISPNVFGNTKLDNTNYYLYHTNNQKVLNYILMCENIIANATVRNGIDYYNISFEKDADGLDALNYIKDNADTSNYLLELGVRNDEEIERLTAYLMTKLLNNTLVKIAGLTIKPNTNKRSNIELWLSTNDDIYESKLFIVDILLSHGIKNEVKIIRDKFGGIRGQTLRVRVTSDFDYIYTLLCGLGDYTPIHIVLNLSSREDKTDLGIDFWK